EAAPAAAAVGRRDLDLDVARKRLDLGPAAATCVEETEAELGKVGHEDVIEVDEDGLPDLVDRLDAEGHQDRVGVGRIDGRGFRRTGFGLEADVAANQVDLVIDALEDEDPLLVEVERVSAHAHTLGDGDGAEEGPIELHRLQLGIELVILAVELEEAVIFLGALDKLVEVLELLVAVAVKAQRELRRSRRWTEKQEGQRCRRHTAKGTLSHGVPHRCAGTLTDVSSDCLFPAGITSPPYLSGRRS